MKKRKNKILYILHVRDKKTGILYRVLTYINKEKALTDLAFYNATLNLTATLDTVIET